MGVHRRAFLLLLFVACIHSSPTTLRPVSPNATLPSPDRGTCEGVAFKERRVLHPSRNIVMYPVSRSRFRDMFACATAACVLAAV